MQREYRAVIRNAMQLATSIGSINIQNQRITESNGLEITSDITKANLLPNTTCQPDNGTKCNIQSFYKLPRQ